MLLHPYFSFGRFMTIIGLGVLIVAALLVINDPMGIWSSKTFVAQDVKQDYSELLAIELLQHDKVRLGYVNGVCEINDLNRIVEAIRKEGKWEWFFGIPLNGTKRKAEYINLVYVDHFERIICAEGIYYRARFNILGNQCRFIEGLIDCGTEFFTERTYNKMVYALEKLGVGDADYFKPRRTINQEVCECN